MIEYNREFSNVFNAYNLATKKLSSYMLKHSFYSECYIDNDGETKYRRPIVIIKNDDQYQIALTLIDNWQSACNKLHKTEPERFPLNYKPFKIKPTIIERVVSGRIYTNKAVSTRKYNADRFIKKLQRLKIKLSNDIEIIEKIESEIMFFNDHKSDLFRIRRTGYVDVIFKYKTDEGIEKKEHINNMGIFINSANGCIANINTITDNQREERNSIYNQLIPIESLADFTGKLYLENDVIMAKKRLTN